VSVVVELSISGEEFPLGKATAKTTGIVVDIHRVIPTGDQFIPYFLVTGENRGTFDEALERSPEIAAFEAVDELDEGALYRAEWDLSKDTFLRQVIEYDAVLQEAKGDADSWMFQLRFPGSHMLSEFHTACRESGIDLDVERLYNPVDPAIVDTREMTAAQQSLIERAYEEGYFDVPRKITLAELADDLGISDQSVNERLRRGLSALIGSTVGVDAPN